MKKLSLMILPLVALFAIAWVLRTPEIDKTVLEEKYTNSFSQFVENGSGLRVHYRDQGNQEGAPIVLLHGTSASLHAWEPLVELLGGEYRIITYTQPGHGLTGPHPDRDYSYAGMAQALDLVVDELGVEKFVLGGNSMGGWMSWRYAVENPDRVAALVLLDASGMPLREGEEAPPLNIGFKLAQNPLGRVFLENYTPRSLVEKSVYETVSKSGFVDDAYVDRYWELLRYPGNRRAMADMFKTDRELQMADRVSEITAPTLLIWGADDQLVYASAAQTFDERMANADAVIYEGIGHLPMEEAPQRTALDIDAFLERTVKRDEEE